MTKAPGTSPRNHKHNFNKWRSALVRRMEGQVGGLVFLDMLDNAVETMLRDVGDGKLKRASLFDRDGVLTQKGRDYITDEIETCDIRDLIEYFDVASQMCQMLNSRMFAHYSFAARELDGVPVLV